MSPLLKSIGGINILSAEELPPWGISAAIYGPPGAGKTTFCAYACEAIDGAPVLDLDAEGGARSIMHLPVEVAPVDTWEKIKRITAGIMAIEDLPYKTIILDNMSEYQALNLKSVAGSGQPQIQHYQTCTIDLLNLTRQYRDLAKRKGINVFFIAWESPEKDDSTGIIKKDVGFTPSLARQFPGIVDIVGYLSVEAGETRRLTFAPSIRTAAKFRRSLTEAARKIPLTINYKMEDKPIVDILNTLRGGADWPTSKYTKQTPQQQQQESRGE